MRLVLTTAALLTATGRLFTTAEAASLGVDGNALTRMLRSGAVHRVAHGTFVGAGTWRSATPERRHLLCCRAVLARRTGVALSHVSAAVAHGLPVHDADLGVVHLTRTTSTGRCGRVGARPPLQIHPALPPDDIVDVDGMAVCEEAAAALQVADWHGVASGMVTAEAALHRRSISVDDLRRARRRVRPGRGSGHTDVVTRLAGPHSESPGETLTRLALLALGVGDLIQQARVPLAGGGTARVDFLLPRSGVVVESDGKVKYGGAEGRDELVREKHREDAIRAAGHPVVRVTNPDLDRPARLRALLLAAGHRLP